MSKIVHVTVQATGGWGFHFGVTEEQAIRIVQARVGQRIALNEPGEVVTIYEDSVGHFTRNNDGGATSEELETASLMAELDALFERQAWADAEDDED